MWRVGLRIAPWVHRRYFRRATIRGQEQAPRTGAVVIAANHFSHLDPVLVGMGVNRPVRYLAVDELFGNSRLFDRLILRLGAVPMSRTRAPLGALRVALRELEAGGAVGVFPEGVRVWTWGEEWPRRGAAWMARRAGAPLLPVAVAGSDQAMGREARGISRQPLAVTVCDPISPEDFDDRKDPLGAMMDEWKRRIGAALQAIYDSGGP